ncbi:hypothetical protein [Trebonia sp.]|uniref:hypothetical protein n=1 Tax=Trebonia sp. TaxID=2767075 RepID=UPI002631E913|nr:hypothetical protein [Trebonia sp.]
MTWLVWRQYRLQAAIAALVLAAFAAIMLITGFQMAAQWHTMLASCTASGTCGTLQIGGAPLGSVLGHDFAILSMLAPALFGALVGAPLVARELETRTTDFVWAQSITRTHWLAAKIGWLLLAAAVWGGVISALVTWWSGPRNAAFANAFQPNYFDQQGLVPVGYSVFATALGIAAGAVFRRTLPAIAIVVGGFIGMRLWVSQDLRMHFMTPVTTYYATTANFTYPAGSIQVGGGLINKAGQLVTGGTGNLFIDGVPSTSLPAACQKLIPASLSGPAEPVPVPNGAMSAVLGCLQKAGYRQFVSYQPISRYWAFQGIETGIYVAVAAALIALTFVVVLRRDA